MASKSNSHKASEILDMPNIHNDSSEECKSGLVTSSIHNAIKGLFDNAKKKRNMNSLLNVEDEYNEMFILLERQLVDTLQGDHLTSYKVLEDILQLAEKGKAPLFNNDDILKRQTPKLQHRLHRLRDICTETISYCLKVMLLFVKFPS